MTQPDPQSSGPFKAPVPMNASGYAESAQVPQVPAPPSAMPAPTPPAPQQPQTSPQPQFGAPEFTYTPTTPTLEAREVPSNGPLVLALLGLFLIGLFGSIPAWAWSTSAIKSARSASLPENSYQKALIARSLGIAGTVIHSCLVVFLVIYAIITISHAIG
ncbi:hypothetical protein [uncultured Actinomyces sp.]|uniref:hypothetical protein n=1 Tax=uncultured Actinomyces sp. TaxID=249061 RepID=UPI0028D1B861|nr:hypothetical protein [uncultured Actinomyces sp.]